MKKSPDINYSENIEYINYYIKELEKRHGDVDQINELKQVKKDYEEQYERTKKDFKSSLKVNNADNVNNKKKKQKTKKKIRRPSIKKQIAIGMLTGLILGVPCAVISYNHMINLPTAHNYTTVREKRKNLEHDDSNYRKYLRQIGLTEEEIDKRIEQEEANDKWNRYDEPDER